MNVMIMTGNMIYIFLQIKTLWLHQEHNNIMIGKNKLKEIINDYGLWLN